MKLKYVIEDESILVKEYLEKVGLSRNLRKKVRVQDIIYINNKKAKNYYELKKGDILELDFKENMNEEIKVLNAFLDIVYEDEYFLIINKPRKISSQPSKKHFTDNVISIVKGYFLNNNINSNIHLVNRLDFNTSGLMIIAKDGITHFNFSKVNITKKYLCEIEGILDSNKGTIDKPIARYDAPSIKRYISDTGKRSITHYQVLKTYENSQLVEATLQTGRTHQIRVHFQSINHPLIGDELYGKKDEFLKLHCYYLKFIHPYTKKIVEVCNYPDWLRR